jgi:predicted DNA-binding protein
LAFNIARAFFQTFVFTGDTMNKGQQTENIQKLLDYALAAEQDTDTEPKKLTCVLSPHYHDALERLAILQGKTKTAIVRMAIDELVKQFGDDILYPALQA